jgi:hypothetical protein
MSAMPVILMRFQLETAMAARFVVRHLFLPASVAITFISFAHSVAAQQCHTAHDPNALKALQERAATGDADGEC